MKNKIFKNDYIFSIITKLVMVVTGFITASIVNRYLGPELKGQYTYIIDWTNLLVIIGNLGLYHSYPKNYKEKMHNAKDFYCNLFFIQFIIYLIIALTIGMIAKNPVIIVASLIVPTQILATQMSMIVMVEKIRYRQYIQIFTMILKTIIMFIVAQISSKLIIAVFIILIFINIIQSILYFYKIKFKFNIKELSTKTTLKILKFGSYACIAELLLIINYKADVIMLKWYVDYYQIGLYSVAISIAECIWLIPDAFKEVLFSRTARGNPINEINFTIKFNVLISIIFIIILYIFDNTILAIYSGNEYLEAKTVMKILLIGVPFMSLFKLTNPLYLSNGKQKQYCLILLVSALTNIVLNLILIPRIGINGAAIASIASFSICGLLFYIIYVKEYKITWYEPLIFNKKDVTKMNEIIIKMKGKN